MGNLTGLLRLQLDSNQLSGPIPDTLLNLTLLTAGRSDIEYNALYTENTTLRDLLNAAQDGGDWESTQTVAPTNITIEAITDSTVGLSWTPIQYTDDTGGYEVEYSEVSGGPYTPFATTPSKSDTGITVTGLAPATTYYFQLRTVTQPHTLNQNTVYSEYTAEDSAITPINDNDPVATDDVADAVTEGGTVTTVDDGQSSLLHNDTDADLPFDTLTVNTTPLSAPLHASAFTLSEDGSFSYTHDGSENFSDSFTYEVSDAAAHTAQATVTITITPVNDNEPLADADSFTVAEGATATAANLDAGSSLLDGDTDADLPNDTLTVNTTPVSAPLHASAFTLSEDGSFSYTHDGTENLSDSFTYEVSDAAAHTSQATVTVTITPVNDAPVITAQGTLTTAEETDLAITLDDLTVGDPDNTYPTGFTLNFTLNVQDGSNYTRTGNIITPDTDFNGDLTVPVTVNDGQAQNGTSAAFDLTVTVTAVNDAPFQPG